MKLLAPSKVTVYLLSILLATISLWAKEPFYTTRLYPYWFNSLGGLTNYYVGYAILTIDKRGGISVKDNFYSLDKEIKERHWITIDEAYRQKDREQEVYLEMTFHYIRDGGREIKESGNGVFKFPPGNNKIHLFEGGTQHSMVIDEWAKEHYNEHPNGDSSFFENFLPWGHIHFLDKTFIRRKKGDIIVIKKTVKDIKVAGECT